MTQNCNIRAEYAFECELHDWFSTLVNSLSFWSLSKKRIILEITFILQTYVSIMSFQVIHILEGNRRKYLNDLDIHGCKKMAVGAEFGALAIAYWKLTDHFEIVDQNYHVS